MLEFTSGQNTEPYLTSTSQNDRENDAYYHTLHLPRICKTSNSRDGPP